MGSIIRFQVDPRIFQVNRGKFSESSQSGEGSEVVVEYHQFLVCDEIKMWCGKQSFLYQMINVFVHQSEYIGSNPSILVFYGRKVSPEIFGMAVNGWKKNVFFWY